MDGLFVWRARHRSAARNPLGAALQYRGLVYCSQMDETMLAPGLNCGLGIAEWLARLTGR